MISSDDASANLLRIWKAQSIPVSVGVDGPSIAFTWTGGIAEFDAGGLKLVSDSGTLAMAFDKNTTSLVAYPKDLPDSAVVTIVSGPERCLLTGKLPLKQSPIPLSME